MSLNYRNDFFFKLAQRGREYQGGNYVNVLDVVEMQQTQQGTLQSIRDTAIAYYRRCDSQLFAGLDRLQHLGYATVESLHRVEGKLDSIDNQIYALRNSLEAGFEELSSKLDISNNYLGQIASLLASPVRTQATEYAERALRSVNNGWREEALRDFEQVVKLDPLSYAAWYNIGLLLLDDIGRLKDAQAAFARTEKYSKPSDQFFYSSSIYYQALIARFNESTETALTLSIKAFAADNRNLAAAFLAAECSADLRRVDECIKYLRHCEDADPIYYLKSNDSKSIRSCPEMTRYHSERTLHDLQAIARHRTALAGALQELRQAPPDGAIHRVSASLTETAKGAAMAETVSNDFLAVRAVLDGTRRNLATIRQAIIEAASGIQKQHAEKRHQVDFWSTRSYASVAETTYDQGENAARYGLAAGVLALLITSRFTSDGWNFTFFNLIWTVIACAVVGIAVWGATWYALELYYKGRVTAEFHDDIEKTRANLVEVDSGIERLRAAEKLLGT